MRSYYIEIPLTKVLLVLTAFFAPIVPVLEGLFWVGGIRGSYVLLAYNFLVVGGIILSIGLRGQHQYADPHIRFTLVFFTAYLIISKLVSDLLLSAFEMKEYLVLINLLLPYFWFILGGQRIIGVITRRFLMIAIVAGISVSSVLYLTQVYSISAKPHTTLWLHLAMEMCFNRNLLGVIWAIGIALLLPIEMKSQRWIKWLALALMLTALTLTFSRSGYLVGITVFGFYSLSRRRPWLILLITWFVVVIATDSLTGVSEAVKERILHTVGRGELDPSSEVRLVLWKAGALIFMENPFFGVGFGRPLALFTAYHSLISSNLIYAHNYFLTLAYQLGIIGLVLGIKILVRCYRLSGIIGPRDFGEAVRLTLGAIVVSSLFGEPLFSSSVLMIFILLLAGISKYEFSPKTAHRSPIWTRVRWNICI